MRSLAYQADSYSYTVGLSYSCVNAATQFAGIAALEGPQNPVKEMVAAFDERRKVILSALNLTEGF